MIFQTDIFNDNSFLCEIHPEQSMKLICYAMNCPYKRRFICLKCILEEQKELNNIATLQEFIQDPISLLDKNKQYQQTKIYNYDELFIQIDEFKIMLQKVQQDILLQLDNLEVLVSNLNKNYQQAQEQVLKRLKFHEFYQQLSLVWKMDSFQGTQKFALLEQQLNNIISSWKDCCEQIAINQYIYQAQLSQDFQQQLSKKLDNKFKLEKNLHYNLEKSLSDIFASQTRIPQFLYDEISKGKQIKYQLLYSGTRDGLNNANYWQKCNFQSHLLTIITLKNGNISGGYTPIQLVLKDDAYWAADDTNQSFVFQQNKLEIYKLKKKQYAIYCSKDYGPRFGTDFYVQNNFKTLGSNLGSNYDITGFNVQNTKTHLIGDKDTEIVECKVFKIKFI